MASSTGTKEARSPFAQTTLSGVTFTFPAYKPAASSNDASGGTNNTAIIASVATASGFFAALLAAVLYSLFRRRRRRQRNAGRIDACLSAKAVSSPARSGKGSISSMSKAHSAPISISGPPSQGSFPSEDAYPFSSNRNTAASVPSITRQALPPLDTVNLHPPAPAYSRHASPIEQLSGVARSSPATFTRSPDSGVHLLTAATSPTSTMAGPFVYDSSRYYSPDEAARVRPAVPSAAVPTLGQMTFREVQKPRRSRRSTLSNASRAAASSLSKALASRRPPQIRQPHQAWPMQERQSPENQAMRISMHAFPHSPTARLQAGGQLNVSGPNHGGTMFSESGFTGMSFKVPSSQYEHQPIGTAERARIAAIPTL